MKKNELEITIKGLPRSGKTTMASVVAEALRAYGLSVTVRDDDIHDLTFKRGAILKGKKVTIRSQTARV